MVANPVALGLVASFNRPGGNITGVTTVIGDILQKRLQLLHDLVPNARRFGYLINPDNHVRFDSPDAASRPRVANRGVINRQRQFTNGKLLRSHVRRLAPSLGSKKMDVNPLRGTARELGR
jgi:hypothetical protein